MIKEELPESISEFINLEELYVGLYCITKIPDLSSLINLKYLNLEHNRIESIKNNHIPMNLKYMILSSDKLTIESCQELIRCRKLKCVEYNGLELKAEQHLETLNKVNERFQRLENLGFKNIKERYQGLKNLGYFEDEIEKMLHILDK